MISSVSQVASIKSHGMFHVKSYPEVTAENVYIPVHFKAEKLLARKYKVSWYKKIPLHKHTRQLPILHCIHYLT